MMQHFNLKALTNIKAEIDFFCVFFYLRSCIENTRKKKTNIADYIVGIDALLIELKKCFNLFAKYLVRNSTEKRKNSCSFKNGKCLATIKMPFT